MSRTAVSKWERGKGYPNIDSLKCLSGFFGVSIDALLSGEELISLATICSVVLGAGAICLFAAAREPYATILLFLFFAGKLFCSYGLISQGRAP